MNNKPEYKNLIDKDTITIDYPTPTGRELLEIAGKKPPEQFAIYLKVKGGQPQRIQADEKVDLRHPGVERFVTLPLDQTEGFDGRRDFNLPQEDIDWLCQTGRRFELVAEGNVLRVVLCCTVSPYLPATTIAKSMSTCALTPVIPILRSIWCMSTHH